MTKKTYGLNRGVFCGNLIGEPEFDHSIEDPKTKEIVKEIYLLNIEVLFENKRKTIQDTSVLPFLVSKEQLEELGDVKDGDILFVKGEWRAYDRPTDSGRRQTITRVLTRKIEKVDEYTRTRNKIEFHGYLKSKIYKTEFDENGKPKRENGRLVPVLDEKGNKIPWTRRNNENLTVNDITIQVRKERLDENGDVKLLYQDFIPAISYGVVAHQIANEIDINSKLKARGYIRRRPKNGYEGEYVYEAVITRVFPEEDEVEKSADKSNEKIEEVVQQGEEKANDDAVVEDETISLDIDNS